MCSKHTYCLRLVHVCEPSAPDPREFEHVVNLFDHIHPSIKIDCIAVTRAFDPAMVQWLSKSMDVPTNIMSMRQPLNGGSCSAPLGIVAILLRSAQCLACFHISRRRWSTVSRP